MRLETLIARLKALKKTMNPQTKVVLDVDGNLEDITIIEEVELTSNGRRVKIILLSSE